MKRKPKTDEDLKRVFQAFDADTQQRARIILNALSSINRSRISIEDVLIKVAEDMKQACIKEACNNSPYIPNDITIALNNLSIGSVLGALGDEELGIDTTHLTDAIQQLQRENEKQADELGRLKRLANEALIELNREPDFNCSLREDLKEALTKQENKDG